MLGRCSQKKKEPMADFDPIIDKDVYLKVIVYFFTCPQCKRAWALDVTWDDNDQPHCYCKACDWTNEVDPETHLSEWADHGEDEEQEAPSSPKEAADG